MKAIMNSFILMISFVRKDMMLLAACIAPILAGVFFRFGIPEVEKLLCQLTGNASVLMPYYEMFDISLSVLMPVMFCFAAAMVILEERDDKQINYLIVTPLGKRGYLIARLGIPFLMSMVGTLILIPVFMLTELSVWKIIFLSVSGSIQGIIIALMIVTFSSNKLEGMAVTKLSTLMVFGFIVPYFIAGNVQYILMALPSFWVGKVIYNGNAVFILPAIVVSFVWIYFLLKKVQTDKKRGISVVS